MCLSEGRDGQVMEVGWGGGIGMGTERCGSGDGCETSGDAFRFPKFSVAMIPAEELTEAEISCTYISA